ncbi:MAG TPA: rhodanese-like domain-containing protein [Candidatus Binataceae bacterium]|nr:rhodanese-like domain-containing protein [Candidatus Binataceae bacterium]
MAIAVAVLFTQAAAGDSGTQLSRRFIIEPNQLPRMLKSGGVVLLSARSKDEVAVPGFVNNAIPIDIDALTTMSEIPGIFTDFMAWEEYIGGFGINNQSTVVIYDDGEMKFGSRARFLLNYFGVRKTFLVNGGYNAMAPLIVDRRLTITSPGVPVAAVFNVSVKDQPIHLVDRSTVELSLGNRAINLLDVRTPPEFTGCLLLPGIDRGGHIPGARNLPIERLLTPRNGAPSDLIGFLDRPGKLNSTLRKFGLRLNDRIIVYCQDGAKSSLAATALVDAGFNNVSLYYLSYLDWQSDSEDLVESIGPCPANSAQ